MLFLGSTSAAQSVELLDTDRRERLAWPFGSDQPFDSGLCRRGWVAVMLGREVLAISDGNLFDFEVLPETWIMAPAADPELVVLSRSESGESTVYSLVDRAGNVVRTTSAQGRYPVGELASGWIVTPDELVSWRGERRPLPVVGTALAVVAGRLTILMTPDGLVMVDAVTEKVSSIATRAGEGNNPNIAYDAEATRVALVFESLTHSGPSDTTAEDLLATMQAVADGTWIPAARTYRLLVVRADGFSRWFEDFPTSGWPRVLWLENGELLVYGVERCEALDVESGNLRPVEGLPVDASPRLDVTSRFNAEQTRVALRPPWRGPIPPTVKAEVLQEGAQCLAAAAAQCGVSEDVLAAWAAPAIGLRCFAAPSRVPLGTSRLGGRPDMPIGRRWPMYGDEPMVFLGQLHTADLNAALAGTWGDDESLLTLFAALHPEGGYSLATDALHVEVVGASGLRRLRWPARLAPELRYRTAQALAFPVLTLPEKPPAGIDDDAWWEALAVLGRPGPLHQLFGHASTIQQNFPAPGRRLLAQFAGDAWLGNEWGDGGRLYIAAPEDTEGLDGRVWATVDSDSY